jgi:hypothetical protein
MDAWSEQPPSEEARHVVGAARAIAAILVPCVPSAAAQNDQDAKMTLTQDGKMILIGDKGKHVMA